MKLTPCDICQKDNVPINESLIVDGKRYCSDCLNTHFPDQNLLKERAVENELDPTICASCGTDFGETVLSKISRYPICDDCAVTINNRVFPGWVKFFMAAIFALVLFSFVWNRRFYQAFNHIEAANQAFDKAEIEQATSLMQTASREVPEVDDIRYAASFFNGISKLKEGNGVEALAEFNRCKEYMPPEVDMGRWIAQAEIGAGFEKKDYYLFLNASKKLVAMTDSSAMALASVASAYACLYAVKGVDSLKTLALSAMQKAQDIDSTSAEMKEYYMRIEHRIYTKEILEKVDFDKKYPNGWTKN